MTPTPRWPRPSRAAAASDRSCAGRWLSTWGQARPCRRCGPSAGPGAALAVRPRPHRAAGAVHGPRRVGRIRLRTRRSQCHAQAATRSGRTVPELVRGGSHPDHGGGGACRRPGLISGSAGRVGPGRRPVRRAGQLADRPCPGGLVGPGPPGAATAGEPAFPPGPWPLPRPGLSWRPLPPGTWSASPACRLPPAAWPIIAAAIAGGTALAAAGRRAAGLGPRL